MSNNHSFDLQQLSDPGETLKKERVTVFIGTSAVMSVEATLELR